MSEPELKYLPIANVQESANNYRKRHKDEKHAEMVASIRERGIITPLVVRMFRDEPGVMPWYEVAAGHRRLRAAREVGLTEVPATVRAMSDREFCEIMITENLQRVDPDPLDEADAYQQLVSALDYDVATLATKFGKSETYIRQRLVLTRLATEVRTALADGAIELGHAVLLARVDEARQRELLESELLASHRMHGAVTRAEIADPDAYDDAEGEIGTASPPLYPARTRISVGALRVAMAAALLPLAPVRWDRDDATLVPTAGSCTACPKRTGANPALFDEFDHADDRCPDRACYGAKKTAYLDARVQACRSQAPALVVISTAYKRTMKTVAGLPVLRHRVDWAPATKGKRGSVPAIVVESDAGALEDWDEVGELRDVQLVKPEKKKAGPQGTVTTAIEQLEAVHRAAAARFVAGLGAVLRAVLGSTAPLEDHRDAVLLQLVHDHAREQSLFLGDDIRELLPIDYGLPVKPSIDSARLSLLIAWVLKEELKVPTFTRWLPADRNPQLTAVGDYAIPPVVMDMAAACGINAPQLWVDAIAQLDTAGAA